MTALTILSTPIRQLDDLYSLNDLHKAAGGEQKHRPNQFLRIEQTQELIAEIETAQICAVKTQEGKHGGTYSCKEIVIAYAAWISAAFHLKVIRVFLNLQPQPVSNPDKFITPEQEGILFNLMAIRFPEGRNRPYGWSRFNRHFVVSSYKNLPASKFAEACCYIPAMPDKEVKALPVPAIKPPVWTKPDPAGTDGAVRNIHSVRQIISDLKIWSHSLPPDVGRPLWNALEDLNNLTVTSYTEITEALMRFNTGANFLNRWLGRNGRIGNVG